MRSEGRPLPMLVVPLIFIVLGATQWAWFGPEEFGQGAVTGGAIMVVISVILLVRGRSANRSSDIGP